MSEESNFSSVGQVLPSVAPSRIISDDDIAKLDAIYNILSSETLQRHERVLGLSHKGETSTRIHAILNKHLMERERLFKTVERCLEPLHTILKASPRLGSGDWHTSKDGIIQNLTCQLVAMVFDELAWVASEKKTGYPPEEF